MSSTRNPGKVAGFLYLLLVLAGPVRIIYIPSKLIVEGNATATANNIGAHESLFRLGIVSVWAFMREEALRQMRSAAEHEDRTDKHNVTRGHPASS